MIPYANMAPYREAGRPRGCVFVPLVPAASVAAIRRGAVLAAALPVGALPALADRVVPVGRYGIGAAQACRSVLVFSRRPFKDVRPSDPVRVTGESATSVRLLQLLLAENAAAPGRVRVREQGEVSEEAAGELLIGDRALQGHRVWQAGRTAGTAFDRLLDYPHVTDLAGEWHRRYGCPFVFARWVVSRQAPPDMVSAVAEWLDSFRAREAEHVQQAVPKAAAATGLGAALIADYFHLIRRCFDADDLAGQALFLKKLKAERRNTELSEVLRRCA